MQPITYSLIFNLVVALLAAGLAFAFAQPLLFLVIVLVQNHIIEQFSPSEDDSQPIGFTADVK